jgi:two-component system cell cycle sensor histidine kinase/response regulator CckA
VESEAGRGTVVSIRLPRAAEATVAEPPTASPAARPQGGDGTVLLVEDEPAVRTIAEQALVAHGFRVVTAADGVEALERLAAAEAPFDLLVTDVVMPRMSGSVLARRLRATCPATAVLLISGYADQPDVESLVREGAGFLAKPFSAGELARAAREAITRHAAVEGASSRV